MKLREILVLAMLLIATACDQKEIPTPSQPSAERRGGNGNGQGGGNQNTNPCDGYVIYPAQYIEPTDWNITVDTSSCGTVIIRWNAQPGFLAYDDACNPIHGKYLVDIQPRPSSCAGSVTSTNAFYYTLGSGCSMWPGKPYSVNIQWVERNETAHKNIYHSSTIKEFSAGTRAPWLNNCN